MHIWKINGSVDSTENHDVLQKQDLLSASTLVRRNKSSREAEEVPLRRPSSKFISQNAKTLVNSFKSNAENLQTSDIYTSTGGAHGCMRSGTMNTLALLQAKHHTKRMSATLQHEFVTRHGVNCIWADPNGNQLVIGTAHGQISIYRLDDIQVHSLCMCVL